MNVNHLPTRVKAVIGAQLCMDAGDIADDTSFVDDIGIDSLDAIEIVMALEQHFDVEISDRDFPKLLSVFDVVQYLQAKILPS